VALKKNSASFHVDVSSVLMIKCVCVRKLDFTDAKSVYPAFSSAIWHSWMQGIATGCFIRLYCKAEVGIPKYESLCVISHLTVFWLTQILSCISLSIQGGGGARGGVLTCARAHVSAHQSSAARETESREVLTWHVETINNRRLFSLFNKRTKTSLRKGTLNYFCCNLAL